jgi:6-phosphogluconate dehydrogenase
MKIGMVGLGKMGANMAARLLSGGHEVVGHDRSPDPVNMLVTKGGEGAGSLSELVSKLDAPRAVWIMVPSGDPVDQTIGELSDLLDEGDLIVDGGNSNYRDTLGRAERVTGKGLHYVDVGTSGGIWGLSEGYSMMVGGTDEAVDRLRPALETLAPAPDRGWGHVGPSGAGHYVKMVHNGIEYGLMQAYAEGFALLSKKEEFGVDLAAVAGIWQHGSVVRSWLLDLLKRALDENPTMEDIRPWVADSGEGRWTVMESIDLAVPTPVIAGALYARFRSRDEESFADRLLAALRNQFGGHAIRRED